MPVSGEGPTPPGSPTKVGRNDPCPCGSGKKYKKCHLPSDEARRAAESQPAPEHALDRRLVEELARFAARRFGVEWQGFTDDFADPDNCLELALPWAVYSYRVQGRSVVETYLDERGGRLSDEERAWLEAQQAAWLSVWEIVDVEAGVSVTLRDLLSGEERLVHEASGSRNAVVGDTLLARVVDYEGASLLCGVHFQPLSPLLAAEVVRRARGRLKRKRVVPVERLRDEGFGRYLIRRWDEAVAELEARAATRPEVRNTDGDPMVLTADHFRLERGARGRVEKRLRGLKGVEQDEPAVEDDDGASVFVFLEPGRGSDQERTLIARLVVTEEKLKLETNSRERADALRGRVEEACGGLLRHVGREHTGPFSPGGRAGAREAPQEPPSPEEGEMMLEFKRRHYADWHEHPLPALGGVSPREAVRTAEGRRAVDALLKDMENRERRAAGEYAFDFGELRRALGLK